MGPLALVYLNITQWFHVSSFTEISGGQFLIILHWRFPMQGTLHMTAAVAHVNLPAVAKFSWDTLEVCLRLSAGYRVEVLLGSSRGLIRFLGSYLRSSITLELLEV